MDWSLVHAGRSTVVAAIGVAVLHGCHAAPAHPPLSAQPAVVAIAAPATRPPDVATALVAYQQALADLGSDLAEANLPIGAKPALFEWWNGLRRVAASTRPELGEIASLNAFCVARTDDLLAWLHAEQERIEDVPEEDAARALAESDALNRAVFEWTKRHQDSWTAALGPMLEPGYVAELVVRRELLARKYLQDEYAEGGNFLEGLVNSRFPLTRFQEGAEAWYREAGVSAFEVPFRIEPLIGLQDDGLSKGLLVSTGLLLHLFPEVEVDGFQARNEESFWSEYLKRVGLRIGAGVGWERGEAGAFVLGAGLQLRSFSAWAVHDFEQDDTSLMLGLSDLGFLQDWIPGLSEN